jgi:hypothetical protein
MTVSLSSSMMPIADGKTAGHNELIGARQVMALGILATLNPGLHHGGSHTASYGAL